MHLGDEYGEIKYFQLTSAKNEVIYNSCFIVLLQRYILAFLYIVYIQIRVGAGDRKTKLLQY